MERTQSKIKKIIFYSGTPRSFRASLIGNLYEIAQIYPVILLSEKLDSQIEEILKDKTLFPKLEKIIPVYQCTEGKMNLLAKHRYSCKLAKDIIRRCKPDIVIAPGYSFLHSYLRRFAKGIGALNVTFMSFLFYQTKEATTEYILRIAYLKAPKFLPWSGKILFSKLRRYLGHFICYWILPLLIGQRPFLKEPSCVLIGDNSRFGGIDYFIVSSKQDCNVLIKDGVPSEKLYILPYSLERAFRLFKKIYSLNTINRTKIASKILTVMWPPEPIGFRRDNFSLISKKELWGGRIEIIALLAEILKEWKIFIKPHPTTENIAEIIQIFKPISNQIEVVNPTESADKYIEISDVVVGLSPASTALSDAAFQDPEKPILSLDLQHEFWGDYFKNFNEVEYVDNKEKFISVLKLIRNNKYRKRYEKEKKCPKEESGEREFSNLAELLEYLFNKNNICLKKKIHI